nr:hypothetical protein [uncultured Bacteroides sp.]
MKKYILMVFALIAGLTSCTNDDITISQTTNFKINPSTVIAPFTYENNPGELEGISSYYRLRIRLLIYNTAGNLLEEETELFTSYASTMGVSKALPRGEYIAIAISDIIANDNTVSYWDLTDYQSLSTATITNTDYIGDYGKEILGITKYSFVVSGAEDPDITINILPAGSLFMVCYWGTQKYSDVDFFELAVSKSIIDCKFDKQGNFTPTWENCDFDKRVNVHEQEGNDGNRYYHYAYVLPTSNLKMKYRAYTTEGEYVDLTPEMNVSPKAGEEYLVKIDLDENHYYSPSIVNGKKTRTIDSQSLHIPYRNSILLKNIK